MFFNYYLKKYIIFKYYFFLSTYVDLFFFHIVHILFPFLFYSCNHCVWFDWRGFTGAYKVNDIIAVIRPSGLTNTQRASHIEMYHPLLKAMAGGRNEREWSYQCITLLSWHKERSECEWPFLLFLIDIILTIMAMHNPVQSHSIYFTYLYVLPMGLSSSLLHSIH